MALPGGDRLVDVGWRSRIVDNAHGRTPVRLMDSPNTVGSLISSPLTLGRPIVPCAGQMCNGDVRVGCLRNGVGCAGGKESILAGGRRSRGYPVSPAPPVPPAAWGWGGRPGTPTHAHAHSHAGSQGSPGGERGGGSARFAAPLTFVPGADPAPDPAPDPASCPSITGGSARSAGVRASTITTCGPSWPRSCSRSSAYSFAHR